MDKNKVFQIINSYPQIELLKKSFKKASKTIYPPIHNNNYNKFYI